MMIPTRVCKAVPMVSGDPSRYVLQSVEVRRDRDGRARATATDGRRLLTVAWDDAPLRESVPAPLGNPSPKPGFRTLLPAKGMAGAARLLPAGSARKAGDIGRAVLLEEPTANGSVRLAATDYESVPSVALPSVEGQFPEWEGVMRAPTSDRTRVVRLDVALLRSTLDALAALGAASVDVDIADGSKSVRLTVGNWDDDLPAADRAAEVIAVCMPIERPDTATPVPSTEPIGNRWRAGRRR